MEESEHVQDGKSLADDDELSSQSHDFDDDPAYTRHELLRLLDTKFRDQSCFVLAQCLRELPSKQLPTLRRLLQRVSNLPRSPSISKDDWRRALSLFGLEVLKSIHLIVSDYLLEELSEIRKHIQYWEKQKERPGLVYLQKGPLYWWKQRPREIGDKPWYSYISVIERNAMDDTLTQLRKIEGHFLSQVGGIHFTVHLFDHLASFEEEIGSFEPKAQDLFRFLTAQEHRRVSGPPKFLSLLEEMLDAITDFEERLNHRMQALRKPPHLQRYWLHYSVGLTAAALAARSAYVSWEALTSWMETTLESLGNFCREHVIDPARNVYHYVFRTFKRQDGATDESVADAQRSLQHMLLDYGKANASEIARRENIGVADFRDSLPARAAAGDMSIVMSKYEADLNHPVKHMVSGDIIQGLLIQIHKVKLDGEVAKRQLDQILESNAINFQMLAFIPAVVGLWAFKRYLFNRPERVVAHMPLRRRLRAIEDILLSNLATGQPLSFDEMGSLLLNVHEMEAIGKTRLRDKETRQLLSEDCAQLKSLDLMPDQKLHVIARMYRTHVFLRRV